MDGRMHQGNYQQNMEELRKLIADKLGANSLVWNTNSCNSGRVDIRIVNACRDSVYAPRDQKNDKAVDFFKKFPVEIKEGQPSRGKKGSYDVLYTDVVITVEKNKIQKIINDLKQMPTPKKEPYTSKRCENRW